MDHKCSSQEYSQVKQSTKHSSSASARTQLESAPELLSQIRSAFHSYRPLCPAPLPQPSRAPFRLSPSSYPPPGPLAVSIRLTQHVPLDSPLLAPSPGSSRALPPRSFPFLRGDNKTEQVRGYLREGSAMVAHGETRTTENAGHACAGCFRCKSSFGSFPFLSERDGSRCICYSFIARQHMYRLLEKASFFCQKIKGKKWLWQPLETLLTLPSEITVLALNTATVLCNVCSPLTLLIEPLKDIRLHCHLPLPIFPDHTRCRHGHTPLPVSRGSVHRLCRPP